MMWELGNKKGWVPNNWCLQTAVLEKTLESPSNCKEIKPINPKEINPRYSLEGLMLKLKLQYLGHLMWRADPLEKTLMLGKADGRRRRGEWLRTRCLDGITDSVDMNLRKLQEKVKDRKPGALRSMGSQRVGHDWATERLNNNKSSSPQHLKNNGQETSLHRVFLNLFSHK